MTAPVDPTAKLGPGELSIGETATALDVSCLVNSFTITASKDQADSTTKLCGTVKPGVITYTYQAAGNLDLDATDPAGLFALSQQSKGTQVPFTFTPNTESDVPSVSGSLILDPMDYGGDTYGAVMASDVAWDLVGEPVYTWPTGGAAADAAVPAA